MKEAVKLAVVIPVHNEEGCVTGKISSAAKAITK
jgi:hypothetical protein